MTQKDQLIPNDEKLKLQPVTGPQTIVNWRHVILVILCLLVGATVSYLWREKEIQTLNLDLEQANEMIGDFRDARAISDPAYTFTANAKIDFTAPYVLNWVENGAEYVITGVGTGKLKFTRPDYRMLKPGAIPFADGEEVDVLRLIIKVTNGVNGNTCLPLTLRLTNEEGDVFAPLTQRWNMPGIAACPSIENSTVTDIPLYFPIEKNQSKFEFLAIDKSNLHFEITTPGNFVGKMINKDYDKQRKKIVSEEDPINLISCNNVQSKTKNGEPVRELIVKGVLDSKCVVQYISLASGSYGDYTCSYAGNPKEITLNVFKPDSNCVKVQ